MIAPPPFDDETEIAQPNKEPRQSPYQQGLATPKTSLRYLKESRSPSTRWARHRSWLTRDQNFSWQATVYNLFHNLVAPTISPWFVKHRAATLVLVYAALAAVLAIPMLSADVPLGADDLNHLARIYVRAHLGSDPDLARFYRVKTDIIPYLGMDLLLTPLAHVLPILLVGRLYILALVWAIVGSVMVLQRTFTGRIGFEPAAAGLLAYNGLLGWGLLNYLLGMVLALLLFAGWHSQRAKYWLTRLAVFTCGATLLYLTHLIAFVLYGILVVSYEVLSRPTPWRTPLRDWLVLAGQAVPAMILWMSISGQLLGSGSSFIYSPITKIWALALPFIFEISISVEGTIRSLKILCILAAMIFVSTTRGWLTWHRSLVGPILVLLSLTLIMPFRTFDVALIDQRFALPALCLAIAASRVAPSIMVRAFPAFSVIAIVTVAHVKDVSSVMHRCDIQYAELRSALATLPRGVKLTTVLEKTDPAPGTACTALPIYAHIAQLVAIDRSGFAPDFFAIVVPVAVRDGIKADMDPESAETFTAGPPGGYVLWIHLGRHRQPPAGFVLLRSGSFFDLWSVRV